MRVSTLTIVTVVALLLLVGAPETAIQTQETDTHRLEEVAEGVYFAVGTGSIFVMSNALVIVNDEDVVVVDSHITPAAARALIASIRAITDKPITTLINSHFHYDHAHGAQAFGNVQIIGHEFTREKLTGDPMNEHTFLDSKARFDRTLDRLEARLANVTNATERLELETQVEFNRAHIQATKEVTPVPPDVTMSDRLTLFRGDREIQIHFFGRAHTGGDVGVYLPEDKILFTGDMLLGGISYLGDGYVGEWAQTLQNLKQLDIDLVLPGHGPGFRDLERIDYVQAYYRDLHDGVVRLKAGGATAEEAAVQVDLTHHGDTLGVNQMGANLEAVQRIYALLDGTAE